MASAFNGAVHLAIAHRRATSFVIHVILIVAANYLAFALRFDGAIPPESVRAWKTTVLLLVAIRTAVFVPLRLYEGLWRYVGLWDLQRIALGVVASSALWWGTIRWITQTPGYPRSIYVIDTILLVSFMGGARLTRRILRVARRRLTGRRVLILGAGDAGEMIVHDMQQNPRSGMEPIGFIDDDPKKAGKRIHGIRVLGTRADLDHVIKAHAPDEILIAIPSETPENHRRIAASLESSNIPVTVVPSLRDLVEGQVSVNQIRPLAIEDLLPRAPVGLDLDAIRALVAGRRVLVTGAGGSIGSELCRQIAALGPERLALVERYENSLHGIAVELGDRWPATPTWPYLADVTDRRRLERVFAEVRPQIVFHAAAHKHVPMVEMNPSEGVKNNVHGTRTLAEVSEIWGVDRFVFISTDKAVNPTNVMGATKRVAEFCIQSMNTWPTVFCAVRFGNVLGSNGSVVPRFLEQIAAGGPVTVTHPDIKRFFMLIPEAVRLVLHAASQATPGAVYVLEMGDQIKVADLARNLIRLTGHVPDKDIKIEFVGLRPGEKLYEELVGTDEATEPSGVEGIHRVVREHVLDRDTIRIRVDKAIEAAIEGRDADVIRCLKQILPTYRPYVAGSAPHTAEPTVAAASAPPNAAYALSLELPPSAGAVTTPVVAQ